MLTYYLLALLPAIAAFATGSIAIYVWQQRSVTGAKTFFGCILSIFIWCFFAVLEYLSTEATPRIVFGKLQYLGIPFFAVYWLIFTLQYTHNDAHLNHQRMRLLMVVPVLSMIFAFTDPWHGLIWTSVELSYTPAPQLMIQHGWWFSYVIMIVGLFRGKLFEVSPISYRTVFLNTEDAVIFLDTKNHIVDLNPSACQESLQRDVLGKPFHIGFPAYQHLLTMPLAQEVTEIVLSDLWSLFVMLP